MQSLKQGWRFYKEVKSTNLNTGSYVLCYNERNSREVYLLPLLCRHFRGEDLDSLSLKELQSLEQQLDSALKHIRTRKVKIIVIVNVFEFLVMWCEPKLLWLIK